MNHQDDRHHSTVEESLLRVTQNGNSNNRRLAGDGDNEAIFAFFNGETVEILIHVKRYHVSS